MTGLNKVFKLPTKLNSSLKVYHLHKNQTKILTRKSKILPRKMTIYDMRLLFSAAEGRVYKKNMSIFSQTGEGKQRGQNCQHTTVRGRHHGQTVALGGTKSSAFLFLHGHRISWVSMGGQNTSNKGQMLGQNDPNPYKTQKRTIPKCKTRE